MSIHNTEHSFPSILICTIRLIKANVCLVGRMSEFPPEYVQVLSQQIPSTHCVPILEMGSTKAVLALLRSMKEVPMTVRQWCMLWRVLRSWVTVGGGKSGQGKAFYEVTRELRCAGKPGDRAYVPGRRTFMYKSWWRNILEGQQASGAGVHKPGGGTGNEIREVGKGL